MKIERIDNVIKVRFDQECRLTAPRIFQYDRGQRIEFIDIPDGVEVQFSNDDTDKTSNKIITDSQVEIPDFLIAMNGTITAYLQYIDENSQTTKKFLVIPVQERKQPEEYISEDDKPGFRADMQKIMNDTKEIAESAKKEAQSVREDADAGLFNGKDYNLTDEDREEIADRIEGKLNYVPPTRKIANETLENDITVAQLVNSMTADSEGLLKAYIVAQIVNDSTVKNKADKTYVDELISSLTLLDVKKVDVLPTTDISTSTIYMVPRKASTKDNVYDEYMYVNNSWEHFGTTDIELSEYLKKTRKIAGMELTSDITTQALLSTLAEYETFGPTIANTWLNMYESSFKSTIEATINSNENVSANTEVRHSHNNKDILDKLTESAFEWELLLDKTLVASSSDTVILDFNDLNLNGQFEELKICVTLWSTESANIDVYANDGTEPMVTLMNGLTGGASYVYDITLKNSSIPGKYIEVVSEKIQAGVKATTSTLSSSKSWSTDMSIQSVEDIKKLKVTFGKGWTNSTERHVYVLGKRVGDAKFIYTHKAIDELKEILDENDISYTEDESLESLVEKTREIRVGVEEQNRRISENAENITINSTALLKTNRQLDALWKLNKGISYNFENDSSVAYEKTVPSGAKLSAIKKIGGKTIVWNQLVKNLQRTVGGITIDIKNGYAKFSGVVTGDGEICSLEGGTIIPKHIYAFITTNQKIGIQVYSIDEKTENTLRIGNCIFKCTYVKNWYVQIINPGVGENVDENGYINLFDLTKMFGAGNEPSTVEEFNAMFPNDCYEYNEGELMSFGVNEVVEKGKNHQNTYPIPQAILDLDGYGDGVSSDVYNYVDFENKKYNKRVGKVDLGSLNWIYSTNYSFWVAKGIKNIKNALCSKYPLRLIQGEDKVCHFNPDNMVIIDSSYMATDIEAFKQSLQGVMLYYELAEEKITDISDIIDGTFQEPIEVEASGTLTFRNSNDDGYCVPVPNEEEYIISLAEVSGND